MSRGSSALDRASSAINRVGKSKKVRKSLQDSETSDDAAELNQFLAGLSQKGVADKTQTKKYAIPAGLSDISISSDDDFKPKPQVQLTKSPSIGGSKFLKSAKAPPDTGKAVANYSASLPQKSVTSAMTNQNSPALLRLSQQAQKFMKGSGGSSLPRKSGNSLHFSEDTTIVSETSESIGGHMNKFLKSKQAPAIAARKKTPIPVALSHSLRTSTEDDSDMAAYIRGLSPSASEVSEEVEIRPTKPKSFMKTPAPVLAPAKPVEVEVKDDSSFATETFSAESSVETRTRSRQRSIAFSIPDNTEDYESEIATESEGPIGGNVVMEMSALSLEPARPIAQSSKQSLDDKKSRHRRDSRSSPDYSQRSRKSSKSKHKKERKKSRSDDVYGTLGLMSVDDLMQTQSSIQTTSVRSSRDGKSIRTESSIKSYRSSPTRRAKSRASSMSSIHTYKESVKTESIDSEIKTHSTTKKDYYDSDFDDTLHETESIKTDDDSRSADSRRSRTRSYSSEYSSQSRSRSGSPTYTRSQSPSYSTRSQSYSRSFSSRTRSSSRSISGSPSRTRSSRARTRSASQRLRHQTTSRSRSVSPDETLKDASEEYTASFEDLTGTQTADHTIAHSVKASDVRRYRPPCTDAANQTGLDLDEMILKYYWMSDQAIPTPSTQPAAGPEAKPLQEPPKIAKMAVSSEALDVLTTYNPAMLALNDMMRQQVELNRQFLDMQKDMHKNIMGSIEREHHYTTLEDTKQFIESKRKPRLTFEEALSMVKEEMGV